MFTTKWGESHHHLQNSVTSSVGLDCVAGKFCMVLTIKGALQFAAVVPGMLVHTKACHIFPTLLGDLVKNIISAKKTHFGIFLDHHQTPKLPSLRQHFFVWELGSSTKAKQWHKWAEGVGLQLRPLTQDMDVPLPTFQVLKIASGTTVGPSAQGSVPAVTLAWCYIRVRSRCTHTAWAASFLCFPPLFFKLIFLTKPADGREGGGGTTACRSISSPHTGMRSEREQE